MSILAAGGPRSAIDFFIILRQPSDCSETCPGCICMLSRYLGLYYLPSARMRSEGYSSRSVCLCVCVSVFSILSSRAFRRPTRGISGYSAGSAKSRFL